MGAVLRHQHTPAQLGLRIGVAGALNRRNRKTESSGSRGDIARRDTGLTASITAARRSAFRSAGHRLTGTTVGSARRLQEHQSVAAGPHRASPLASFFFRCKPRFPPAACSLPQGRGHTIGGREPLMVPRRGRCQASAEAEPLSWALGCGRAGYTVFIILFPANQHLHDRIGLKGYSGRIIWRGDMVSGAKRHFLQWVSVQVRLSSLITNMSLSGIAETLRLLDGDTSPSTSESCAAGPADVAAHRSAANPIAENHCLGQPKNSDEVEFILRRSHSADGFGFAVNRHVKRHPSLSRLRYCFGIFVQRRGLTRLCRAWQRTIVFEEVICVFNAFINWHEDVRS